jgi:hypothetical protein
LTDIHSFLPCQNFEQQPHLRGGLKTHAQPLKSAISGQRSDFCGLKSAISAQRFLIFEASNPLFSGQRYRGASGGLHDHWPRSPQSPIHHTAARRAGGANGEKSLATVVRSRPTASHSDVDECKVKKCICRQCDQVAISCTRSGLVGISC